MRHRSTLGVAAIAWMNQGQDVEVLARVVFSYPGYIPQTWEEPASGGGIEDCSFTVTAVKLYDPSGGLLLEVSGNMISMRKWEAELRRQFDDDIDGFRASVEAACYESLGDDREYDG